MNQTVAPYTGSAFDPDMALITSIASEGVHYLNPKGNEVVQQDDEADTQEVTQVHRT